MTRGEKGNFVSWSLVSWFVFSLFAIAITMPIAVRVTRISNAERYFGISKVGLLSPNEKIMFYPMVENRIAELKANLNKATGIYGRALIRTDITPSNADRALEDLREADRGIEKAQRDLEVACSTARYWSLIPENFGGCK